MADNEKSATFARLGGLAIILALGAFYIVIGHEWYFSGKMVLCTYDETVNPGSWCYKPPLTSNGPVLSNGSPQSSIDTILENSLSTINDTYRGEHQWFNDDIVGNLFEQIGKLLQ